MQITDTILQDFQQGSIATLYDAAYASLLAYSARCLGVDYAFLAEDCVQEAVLKAYCDRGRFDNGAHLKAFLYMAIHNHAVSLLRKRHSSAHYLAEQTDLDDDLQTTIIEQETLDRLYAAIAALPARLRQIFDLSFEQGLKNAEVAALLSMSESNVKKQKAKLIATLRDELRDSAPALVLLAEIIN